MRDHDYRRPPSYKLMSSAAGGKGIEEKLERYHYTPGAFLFGADQGDATPSADDKGKARTDEKEAATLAQKRLDAKRGSARVCTFETNAHDLAPGVVMSMVGHQNAALGESKTLLIVGSSLSGMDQGEWSHHCEARGTEIPYRPEVVTPKPKVNGVESATVVGPAGEEIHTDEFGRVRVHFHWDRESQMDDNSSCWIHVSQPWGGASYGGTSLPRIGQEVLVDFLGGDPDRPIIVGRVYTNLQKTPYKLPDNKTQSGWKSNSTGGGGGYNELMFEDAVGKELLNMQAEKDLKKLVKNNESVTIGNNRTKVVGANDSLIVGANRTHRVQLNEQISVGMNQTVSVGINRATQVGSSDTIMAGELFAVSIAPPGEGWWEKVTRWIMYPNKLHMETQGGAKIVIDGTKISIDAEEIAISATKITVNGDDISITGKDSIKTETTGGDTSIKSSAAVKIEGAVVDLKGNPIKLNC
jgi:type VI secretion system secreted protein VgrG